MLGLYHDVVVLRHLRRAAGAGQADVKLTKADWLRVTLTGLQHMELFAEVAAYQHSGSSGKWTAVTIVESLKHVLPFYRSMMNSQPQTNRAPLLSDHLSRNLKIWVGDKKTGPWCG